MRFSEAVRYLSRLYGKESRDTKHRRSNSSIFLTGADTRSLDENRNQSQNTSAIDISPRWMDCEVTDQLTKLGTNYQAGISQRSSKAAQSPQAGTAEETIDGFRSHQNVDQSRYLVSDFQAHADRSRDGIGGDSDPFATQSSDSLCSDAAPHNSNKFSDANQMRSAGIARLRDANTHGSIGSLESINDSLGRRFSDQTVFSDSSAVTVHHHPSRRSKSLIAILDSSHEETKNPFSDDRFVRGGPEKPTALQELGQQARSLESDPIDELEEYTRYSGARASAAFCIHASSRSTSSWSDDLCDRIFASTDPEWRERIRSKAARDFNAAAAIFGLEAMERNALPSGNDCLNTDGNVLEASSSLRRRIRSVKSTLSIKHKNNVKRTLRRIKTLANLSCHFRLGSLKGKTLKELARLGGYSFLPLQAEYAPAPLKLPTLIAGTALYLLRHGTTTPYIFADLGNEAVVSRLYSYYATELLSAELEPDQQKIERTVRTIALPPDSSNLVGRSMEGNSYIHCVSTVFKHFLSGIPGGILGSVCLYRVLNHIHNKRFIDADAVRDPGRHHYVSDASLSAAARSRMITLAIVALTDDMQLELICAVFGLLALTADRSKQRARVHKQLHGAAGLCEDCAGLVDSDLIGEAFGALLSDTKGTEGMGPTDCSSMEGETAAGSVATMLIDLWQDICTQLRSLRLFEFH